MSHGAPTHMFPLLAESRLENSIQAEESAFSLRTKAKKHAFTAIITEAEAKYLLIAIRICLSIVTAQPISDRVRVPIICRSPHTTDMSLN